MCRADSSIGQLTQQPAMDSTLLVTMDGGISLHFQTGMSLVNTDDPKTQQLRNGRGINHAAARIRRQRTLDLPLQVFENGQLRAHAGCVEVWLRNTVLKPGI